MKKIILISDSLDSNICCDTSLQFPCRKIKDIKTVIEDLLTNIGDPLGAIFFITPPDYTILKSYREKIDESELFISLIIVKPGEFDISPEEYELKYIQHFSNTDITPQEYRFLIQKSDSSIEKQYRKDRIEHEYVEMLEDMKNDQEDLIQIGRALSTEKEPDKLFRLILMQSKKITGADAGSIFTVEQPEEGTKILRFKYSHTFSKELPYEEFVMPLDTNSIAGYVAVTGNILNIPDVYKLSTDDPVSFNSSFDKAHQYRSKSMLVVPMRNHIDEIIGVIQLINSKEDPHHTYGITGNEAFEVILATPDDFENKVVPFDKRYENLMEAVAGQAAIAIENNRMIKQIQNQFEEFVRASVTAIESRDVATSGHSFRVAELCKELAYAINDEKEGHFKDITFSDMAIKELELAALLHDFGKVYIDLAIFKKAKKLFPRDYDNLMLKMNYIYRFTEIQYSIRVNELMEKFLTGSNILDKLTELGEEKDIVLKHIREIKERLVRLNEPTVMDQNPEETISEIDRYFNPSSYYDMDGHIMTVLTDNEKISLQTRRGSLNPEERKEIESHVIHTYNFVSKIPWPPEYKNIPEIALKHHEKLDGTGYPNGLLGLEQIPLQARMMALADIFDALAAQDRPYKKAVPLEKTLEILREEADNNKLDAHLVDIFIKHKLYERIDLNSYKVTSNL